MDQAENRLASALTEVKTLDLSIEDFGREFSSIIHIEQSGTTFGIRFIRPVELPTLSVSADDVKKAIEKCLGGRVPADALRSWANFLILCDAFEFEGRTPLGSVLHLLASPEIHGELDERALRYYVTCLESSREPD